MESKPIVLPIITVQHDILSVFSDVDSGLPPEDVWVSVYKDGEPSVHGKVRVLLDEVDRSLLRLESHNGIKFNKTNRAGKDNYSVVCESLDTPSTDIAFPRKEWADPERSNPVKPYAVTAFDVAPDGNQFATGYHDGTVHLSNADESQRALQKAKPHLSTVTALRFFPSSRVLLTAGNDFSLTILPAEPSTSERTTVLSPVRTLRAHTRSITSVEILDIGRNILSASKDATVRLWDVAAGKVIRTAASAGFAPVLAVSVGDNVLGVDEVTQEPAEGEVGTANKLAFSALGDGTFEALDLGARRSAFHSATKGPSLTAISFDDQHNLLATGSANGLLQVWDTRSLDAPVVQFRRGGSAVEQISFLSIIPSKGAENEVGLAVSTADGLPFVASVWPEGPRTFAELIGPDCEHVGGIKVRGNAAWNIEGTSSDIWTAADDGHVRVY